MFPDLKKCAAQTEPRTKNAQLRCCYTYDSIVSARAHETGEYIFTEINVPMQRQGQTLPLVLTIFVCVAYL